MAVRKRTQRLAHAVANRLFEDFLDVRHQGVNFTWETGARIAGDHAGDQLTLSYARAPKDLAAQVEEAKALAIEQFRKRMAEHVGELPLRSSAEPTVRTGMKP
jgi:dihydroneopterin aldolase